MAKWIFLGAPWLACLTFLGAGANVRQNHSSLPPAVDLFVPQPFPPGAAADRDPALLFDRILASLRQARWLRLTIWQRQHDAQDGYESEAQLCLGPDHCARMETIVRTDKVSCQTLLVSDGRTVAEAVRLPGAVEKVTGAYLPVGESPAARARFLEQRGCVGPLPLLTDVRQLVPAWKLDTGTIQGRALLRLQGNIDANLPKAKTLAAHSCCLYLDAATLLPVRLEWRTGADPSRLRLEMEFRDLEIDHPLSKEECAREFSYNSQ